MEFNPTAQSTEGIDAENPWPGLVAFREEDQTLFYGREAEAEKLLDVITRERVAVLFSLSGLGKTSLIRAGLFPRLRQKDVLPIYLHLDFSNAAPPLTQQVLTSIASEAAAADIEAPVAQPGETLWEFFHRRGSEFWSPRNRLVTPLLAFDQLEEIFTIGRQRKEESRSFLVELTDLAEGRPPITIRERLEENPIEVQQYSFSSRQFCKILLSLREEFLAELEALSNRARPLWYNRFRLLRMNGETALRAVARTGRHLLSEDVAQEVVRFVADWGNLDVALSELEVEPSILSVVCRELNNRRQSLGEATITSALLVGNRGNILSDFYLRSLADLGSAVRQFVEEQLLTRSGFRDSFAMENALAIPGVTREALWTLVDRRLLRLEDRNGVQRIELTHDILISVVLASRDGRRQDAAEKFQAVLLTASREHVDLDRLVRWNRLLMVLVVVLAGALVLLAILKFR